MLIQLAAIAITAIIRPTIETINPKNIVNPSRFKRPNVIIVIPSAGTALVKGKGIDMVIAQINDIKPINCSQYIEDAKLYLGRIYFSTNLIFGTILLLILISISLLI